MSKLIQKIYEIEHKVINECELYGQEGKDAEAMVHYLSGVVDMAGALIRHLEEKED